MENIRFWARFWSQKSSKIDFPLFLRSKLQKAPKTRFGRKSAKFCKNGYFLAPEAFILRPSRKPFCRQCFFRCFEAHFHTFRTFPLIFSFFHQKVILSTKTGFERQKAHFCVLGHLFGSFSHPCANVALDNGFFGVLSSIFHFLALLEPIFGSFAPKCTFGAKNHFWG